MQPCFYRWVACLLFVLCSGCFVHVRLYPGHLATLSALLYTDFFKYFQLACMMMYHSEIFNTYTSCQCDLWFSLWPFLWTSQTWAPLGNFAKYSRSSEFWYYVTCSASDLKIHKLFSSLLLFTLYKRIRLFSIRCTTANEMVCNARHNAFLMSEGHTWLDLFFSVGKNFCHTNFEPDELILFFLVNDAPNTNLIKHGEILLLRHIINHLFFPFFKHFAVNL